MHLKRRVRPSVATKRQLQTIIIAVIAIDCSRHRAEERGVACGGASGLKDQ
jgi:hypothetical protein